MERSFYVYIVSAEYISQPIVDHSCTHCVLIIITRASLAVASFPGPLPQGTSLNTSIFLTNSLKIVTRFGQVPHPLKSLMPTPASLSFPLNLCAENYFCIQEHQCGRLFWSSPTRHNSQAQELQSKLPQISLK